MAKILIVEDEKAINDLVKFNLELVGHECSQVFDGESGLTEALKLKHDLIILDVMLPSIRALRHGIHRRNAGNFRYGEINAGR